jgi:undecaprenyl-diphosphatase
MRKPNPRDRIITLAAVSFAAFELILILFVDRPLSEYLRTVDAHDPAIIDFFRAYTDLGLAKWYEWPSGIVALACFAFSGGRVFSAKKRKLLQREGRIIGFFFACIALSGIVTDILKPLFGRARPVLLDRVHYYGFVPLSIHANYNSFPSGHATTAFALAFALIALWPRGRPWLIAFAVAIGVSRVMVNGHFLSDVFAGAAVGWLTVLGLHKLFAREDWLVLPPGKG